MSQPWTLDGYPCDGPHHIVRWSRIGPSIVVARSTLRGRPWLRAVRKLDGSGFWVSAYKTKRLAVAGSF